jgi:hypothetical protein
MPIVVGESVRAAILDLNRNQREGLRGLSPGGRKDAFGKGTQTWGRHFMRIPEDDWAALCRINPDLNSKDPKVSSAAMLEFEKSDASLPYRVTKDYHGPGSPILFGAGRNRKAR